MSLQTRLTALTLRVGQEINELRTLVESSGGGVPEISGSRNNNDYYEKYPDGRLVCLGRRSFPANANTGQSYTWNFPVSFAGEIPQVDIISSTTVPQNISLGIVDEALSSVSIRFFRTTGSATTVFYSATGRWK